ncbi:MAG: TolC family protein [Bacillota bacterium]
MNYYKQRLITVVFVLLLIVTTATAGAQELSLKEAVNWGLEHSASFSDLEYSLNQAKRDLAKAEARMRWQADLEVMPSYGYETETISTLLAIGDQVGVIGTTEEEQLKDDYLAINLAGSKKFAGGLEITQNVSLLERDPYDFNNVDDNIDLQLQLSQDIYPQIPFPAEQNYQLISTRVIKLKRELAWTRRQKKIDWLADYLNILRLEEKLRLLIRDYKLVQADLKEVKREAEINEADRLQVLTAQIRVKEAKLIKTQIQDQLIQSKDKWFEELSLADNHRVVLSTDSSYFKQGQEVVKANTVDFYDQNKVIKLLKSNNWQLENNQLEQNLAFKQKRWQELSDKPQLKLGGDYDLQSEDWKVQLSLTYNLLDGGERRLKIADYQEQITKLERDYDNLWANLELDFERLLDGLKQAQINLQQQELVLEKAKLAREIAQERLALGAIKDREFKKEVVDLKKAEVDLKKAEDRTVIAQLRLMHLLGFDKLFASEGR